MPKNFTSLFTILFRSLHMETSSISLSLPILFDTSISNHHCDNNNNNNIVEGNKKQRPKIVTIQLETP